MKTLLKILSIHKTIILVATCRQDRLKKNTNRRRTSARCMIKRRGLKQFKLLKTTMMGSGKQERRANRAGALVDSFRKSRFAEKSVWQDEKDFTLDIALNSQISRVYGF